MLPEEPTPPTERSCPRCGHLLTSELEESTFQSSPSLSWKKLLIDRLCSLGLPATLHFILPRRPSDIVRTEIPPRHSINPQLGLLDLVSSFSATPASAPLLLSPLVGRHEDVNARPSTFRGKVLVEIFAVHTDFPFSGTISLFDGRAANYIYRRHDWDSKAHFYSRQNEWLTTHADSSSKFKHELPLTGPGRAFSAFSGFGIHVDVPATDEHYGVACYESPDDWDEFTKPDQPNTITIATNMGSLYVTCAVLTNAVRANVKFMVRLPWLYAFALVNGRVMAYIDTFEVGATLFSRGDDIRDAEDVPFIDSEEGTTIGTEFCLPLDRYPLVVPIGSCLHIKGEFVVNGSETISVNHSIPTDSPDFETGWDEDEELEIQTAVRLSLRDVWA